MKTNPTLLFTFSAFAFGEFLSSANAAVLASWNFDGFTGSEAMATAGTIDSSLGANSAILSRGAGLNLSDNGDRFNATEWATGSIANAVTGNDYFQFSLNYNGSASITVDTINFIWQRSGTGTTGLAIRSSLDSYGTDVATFAVTDNTSSQAFVTTDLGSNFDALTSSVTFRIYGYSEAGTGTGGFESSTTNTPDLVVNGVMGALIARYWLGDDTTRGGDGTWSASGTSWSASDSDGGPSVAYDKTLAANFGGTLGGTVSVSGAVEADNGINFSTTGYSVTGGTGIDLGGANAATNAISVSGTNTATINSQISGTAGFIKTGTGTLILGGANDIAGTANVSAGIVNVRNAAALGQSGIGNETTVTSGAALQLQDGISIAESIALSGTGITNTGAIRNISGTNTVTGALSLNAVSSIISDAGSSLTLNVANGNAISSSGFGLTLGGDGALSVANAISLGAGSLTKSGNGTLTLQSINTYTGGTMIGAGTLSFVSGALGASGTLTFNGGTLQYGSGNSQDLLASRILTGSTRIDTNGNNVTFTGSNSIAGTTFTKLGAGVLGVDPTRTIYTGATTVSGGTLSATGANYFGASNSVISIGAATLQYAASYTGSTKNLISVTDAASTIDVTGSNTYAPGVISGVGTLTKTGSGTLNLVASNTFSGGLVISGGSITLTAANALLNAGSINVNGGTLNMATFSDDVGAVTLTSGTISGTGILTGTSYSVESGSVTGRLGGSAGLTKTTNGTVTISGDNTYSGLTSVNGGVLAYGVNNAIASGGISINGGTLDLATFTDSVGIVTMTSGSISGTIGILSASSFLVESGSISARLNDATGNVSLIKSTSGTVILTGSNLYAGGTFVEGGTLLVNNTSGSGTGDGAVTISSGGTLGGSGTIAGATTVQGGGTHSAGASAGAFGNQSFSSNLTYAGNAANSSIFSWDLNSNSTVSGFDTVTGTGAGTLNIDNSLAVDPVFKIVLGSTAVMGINNLAESFWDTTQIWSNIFNSFGITSGGFANWEVVDSSNNPFSSGRGSFSVSGTSVTWTAVPEPSSALAGTE